MRRLRKLRLIDSKKEPDFCIECNSFFIKTMCYSNTGEPLCSFKCAIARRITIEECETPALVIPATAPDTTSIIKVPPDKGQRTCTNCKKPFEGVKTRTCSKTCRNIVRQTRKMKNKTENSKYGLCLKNEREFAEWFKINWFIFGIDEIIKINPYFPDVIARIEDKIITIELEYFASNFKPHKHDANACDIVISYARCKGEENTIRGVPIISLFVQDHNGNNISIAPEMKSLRKTILNSRVREYDPLDQFILENNGIFSFNCRG